MLVSQIAEAGPDVAEHRIETIPVEGGTTELAIFRPVSDGALPLHMYMHGGGWVAEVAPGVSVLEAVRRARAEVLASCEQGTCGRCLTPVLEGRPDHRDSRLADHQRAAKDCMFLCVSRSCGARALDL
ncbi:2Fe-2S iron-sulfur cluster-binding protein [Streptomyces sp. NPDC060053]|uniref:2Fe-2S iron-sulfur cluster-binding protein n=1 Tax=Streptomyces sp. NPDC060053 TaxID=3347047 RepID=UPI0036C9027B